MPFVVRSRLTAPSGWEMLSFNDPRYLVLKERFPGVASLPRGRWMIRRDVAGSVDDRGPNIVGGDPSSQWNTVQLVQPDDLLARGNGPSSALVFSWEGWHVVYTPARKAPPPVAGSPQNRYRRFVAVGVALLVKAKAFLALGSMLVTMLVYGMAFGWGFGVGLVAIIAVHESGHVVANRLAGIRASWPLFIPFLGAVIRLKEFPKSASQEAFIGIMGPVFGLSASIFAGALGMVTGQAVFYAVAMTGFLIHIFNLLPVVPLDGGRTVGFWRWKAWIPGFLGILAALFYNPFTHRFQIDPVMAVIVGFIIVSFIQEFKRHDPEYTHISGRARWGFTALWLLCFAVSVTGYVAIGQRVIF